MASYADVLAIEAAGMPADLPQSTYELIRRGAAIDPAAPALSFFLRTAEHRSPERWDYARLMADIHRAAHLFHSLGARRGTVIALILPNLPETHFAIWGGEAVGTVFAVNPLLEASAIAELLNAAKVELLLTLAPFPGTELWPKVQAVLAQVPSLRELLLIHLADHVRGPRGWLARLLQWREARRLHGRGGVRAAVPAGIGVTDFGAALRKQDADRLPPQAPIRADDLASMLCTGGTTGLPKIALRRHANEVANAWSASAFFGEGVGPGKTLFCGLPLFHANAMILTGLVPFALGAHVLLGTPQGYRGEGVVQRFWEIVAAHRVNFFSGVPTLFAGLLETPLQGHDLSSLQYGLCGAAPMPVELFQRFQQRSGIKILEGYGLTEGTCFSSVNPPLGDDRRIGSIGLRAPGQAMKAVLLDEAGDYQRDCAVDEVGVLVISGPNVFAGYLNAEQNRALWIEQGDGRRWLNTGDLGRCDADGYFWLTGRKKELIIRGGHNIDPGLIEEVLHRHPAVQLAAAVGRPDIYAGELPVAYVQLRDGAGIDEAGLLAFAESEIAERAARPKAIRLVEQMPLTAIGKIYKPALRRQESKLALETALREAGLVPAALLLEDDATRGLLVRVTLADAAAEPATRQLLGRFALAFSLEPAAASTAAPTL